MKLPTVLYVLLVFFNLLGLGFITALFIFDEIYDAMIIVHARFTFYLLYITVLLNLYGLFYMALNDRFND
jgi:hypothetical protein